MSTSRLPDGMWEDVIPLGTEVLLKGTDVKGTIVGVAFYLAGSTMYEVAYWTAAERKEIWVSCPEIIHDDSVKTSLVRIGFKVT